MRLNLVPRERRFYELFARQGEIADEALGELCMRLQGGASRHSRLRELEHVADDVAREIYTLTNATFSTPIEPEDILELAQSLDTIVDLAEEISDKIDLYGVRETTDSAKRFGQSLARAGAMVSKAVAMLESPGAIEGVLQDIHSVENEGDRITREALQKLFNGNHRPAADVIKWKDLYDLLERAMDECESVAEIIEKIAITGA